MKDGDRKMKYDLVALASAIEPRKRAVNLPVIREARAVEQAYLRALNQMLVELRGQIQQFLVTPAIEQAGRAIDAHVLDVDETLLERIRGLGRALARVAANTVSRILNLEGQRHTTHFMRTAHAALGVDLKAVVNQDDLASLLENVAQRNAALITNLSDDTVNRISQTVLNHVVEGGSVKDLTAKLRKEYLFSSNRAKLIARDQTAKLNADLNRFRHEQAGITKYTWRTSEDERVRPRHRILNNVVYEYGQPTGAEEGLPPGKPIRCRCIAQAIVEFDTVKTTKQLETQEQRNQRLDTEARDYVLDLGKQQAVEHITAYDTETGAVLGRSAGNSSFVGFSNELLLAILDPKRSIIAHHNHPSSSSFSRQDLLMLQGHKGLKGVWAHGHNGSSYYAERARYAFNVAAWVKTEKAITAAAGPFVNTGRLSLDDLNGLYNHMMLSVLHKKGRVKYTAKLNGPTLKKWNEKLGIYNDIVEKAARQW